MADESITDPWPKKDIIYVSIMGAVMIAAFLEWFLWLAAFLYCLVKVFRKAEHWSIKLLAFVMMIGFTALRYRVRLRQSELQLIVLTGPSSSPSWSSPYLFRTGSPSTSPKPWSTSCSGLLSGHLPVC